MTGLAYGLLYEISKRHFDGNTLRGPRKNFVREKLEDFGLCVEEDEHSNLWVQKGYTGRPRIFSSHMDVDVSTVSRPDLSIESYTHEKYGKIFEGTMDNSVGVFLNMHLAKSDNSGLRNTYIFTASEEEHPKNPNIFNRSARKIVRALSNSGIKPELCVVTDVTYPEPLYTDKELEDMPTKVWDKKSVEELFDQDDMMHCYIDGFKGDSARKIAYRLWKNYGGKNIGIRKYFGHDETVAYSKISPTIAVGPLFYGKPDLPKQKVRKDSIETAYGFLRFLSQNKLRKI